MVWADLSTPDPARASEFYAGLFGWKMVAGKSMDPVKPGQYIHIVNGTEFIGGMPPAEHRNPHAPASWVMYFDVADCDATIATVTSQGGHLRAGPMTQEHVRAFAVLSDPQGAVFAIVQTLEGAEA